ncbi:MAG: diguanylate cyclase [Nitrospirota bacterium]
MSSPHQDTNDSTDPAGSDSIDLPYRSSDGAASRPFDSARLGVVACLLFMAGGLYWTATVGLLTISALMAYPVMIQAGVLLTLVIFGATFWTPKEPQSDAAMISGSLEPGSCAMHTYDSVTGLPTQRLFFSLLKQALSRAHKHSRQIALLVIELDHFSPRIDGQAPINSNLMYRVQAARVKSALRTADTVARIAERTFVVLLDRVTGPEEVLAIARKMHLTISLPVTLDGHELFLTSRIGISLSSHDTVDSDALLDAATRAVETARTEGYALYGLPGAMASPSVDATSTIAA